MMLAVRACHGRTLRNASVSVAAAVATTSERSLSTHLAHFHFSRSRNFWNYAAEMNQPRKRVQSSQSRSYSQDHASKKGKEPQHQQQQHDDHSHSHSHSPSPSHSAADSHSHSHSHSLFGGHSHSHDGPNTLVEVLGKSGTSDRGSRITILGLVVNVGLTGAKGAAGWYMNSAALLAEAGHSASGMYTYLTSFLRVLAVTDQVLILFFSPFTAKINKDLLGDLVTLFAWRFSRRTPTLNYPYGFGKFETIGTAAVALILIGGAAGIGVHALHLLAAHLSGPAAASIPATGAAAELVRNATEVVGGLLPHSHGHAHGGGILDPNAAWFALASVVIKEWLYRATQRVAEAERSSVLRANAIHHRADAYTSGVALIAILGTWAFPALPLDPLGGLLVALVVLKQGWGLLMGAVGELTDRGIGPRSREALLDALQPLVESERAKAKGEGEGEEEARVEAIEEVRAVRAGALLFVDVRVRVSGKMTVQETAVLGDEIREALRVIRSDLAEVRIRFVPAGLDEEKAAATEVLDEERKKD